MSLASAPRHRAVLAIVLCTLVGACLRFVHLGRIGLVQFDEGIYASSGIWSFNPEGLRDLDPLVIPYAPPGFPILVGLSYLALGVSDISAVLVSILCGVFTIPAVGWIAWRTFGPSAGAAGAAFAALAGPHVVFSRMALTDSAFLLAWLVAIGLGQRFLERPGFGRAIAMGLAVGVAQYFKYNGWLAGATTVLAVLIGVAVVPEERRPMRILRLYGLAAVGALLAVTMDLPWIRFVEGNGGYAGLLAHQRSYTGGLASWLPHWRSQMAQGVALSGGPTWGIAAMLLACAGIRHCRPFPTGRMAFAKAGSAAIAGAFVLGWWPMAPWWAALAWVIGPWASRPAAARALGSWWLSLAALTPFYHPYARLWLPLHAACWVVMAGLVDSLVRNLTGSNRSPGEDRRAKWSVIGVILVSAIAVGHVGLDTPRPRPLRGLLAASDSLRSACQDLMSVIPDEATEIRLLARPPVRFYLALAGKVVIRTESDLTSLLADSATRPWAVVDEAMLRQGRDPVEARRRLLEKYDRIAGWPTELNPPTLLDVDPEAARRDSGARTANLLLLRRRRPRALP